MNLPTTSFKLFCMYLSINKAAIHNFLSLNIYLGKEIGYLNSNKLYGFDLVYQKCNIVLKCYFFSVLDNKNCFGSDIYAVG